MDETRGDQVPGVDVVAEHSGALGLTPLAVVGTVLAILIPLLGGRS